jgi:hypothetical protein
MYEKHIQNVVITREDVRIKLSKMIDRLSNNSHSDTYSP